MDGWRGGWVDGWMDVREEDGAEDAYRANGAISVITRHKTHIHVLSVHPVQLFLFGSIFFSHDVVPLLHVIFIIF